MSPAEDPYGNVKRLTFCAEVIETLRPRRVLDIGCGSGERLTRPMAERFREVEFIGVDSDARSVSFAQSRQPLPNLIFCTEVPAEAQPRFDLIIASEVIEHVEDPQTFLLALRGRLSDSGALVLTLPNGCGPFEIATFGEALLRVSGALAWLRRLRRMVASDEPSKALSPDTLATSPHVNFFSRQEIEALCRNAGFEPSRYRARTFLCGLGFDSLLGALDLCAWNARVADRLPASLVSAWMFVLAATAPRPAPAMKRGAVSRWRQRLNRRAFG